MNRRAVALLGLPPQLRATRRDGAEIIAWQRASGEFARAPEIGAIATAESPRLGRNPVNYERLRPDGTVLEVRTITLADGRAVRTYTDVTERRARPRRRDGRAPATPPRPRRGRAPNSSP